MKARYGCYRFVARAFLIGDALPAASAVHYGFVPGEPSALPGAGAGLVDQGRVSWPFARLASVGPGPARDERVPDLCQTFLRDQYPEDSMSKRSRKRRTRKNNAANHGRKPNA